MGRRERARAASALKSLGFVVLAGNLILVAAFAPGNHLMHANEMATKTCTQFNNCSLAQWPASLIKLSDYYYYYHDYYNANVSVA